jgi:membrane protein YdbS with pleckstrin-like domain
VNGELAGPRRLHPISVVGTSLKSLPSTVIGMIGAFTVIAQRSTALAVSIAVGLLLVMVVGALIGWWRFTYEVREREIVIQQGLLSRQRRVIPFDRVRDIAIERPLLARLVGTAKVRIETGGAKGDEGLLDMIELETAHELRDSIRRSNLLEPAHTSSNSEPEAKDAPVEPVIFSMSPGRVLGSGLFNFSLIFIALAFGALQYLDDLGIFDFETYARSEDARGVAGMFDLKFGLIVLGLLILLGGGERRAPDASPRSWISADGRTCRAAPPPGAVHLVRGADSRPPHRGCADRGRPDRRPARLAKRSVSKHWARTRKKAACRWQRRSHGWRRSSESWRLRAFRCRLPQR